MFWTCKTNLVCMSKCSSLLFKKNQDVFILCWSRAELVDLMYEKKYIFFDTLMIPFYLLALIISNLGI